MLLGRFVSHFTHNNVQVVVAPLARLKVVVASFALALLNGGRSVCLGVTHDQRDQNAVSLFAPRVLCSMVQEIL